jgi:hypothetical protein
MSRFSMPAAGLELAVVNDILIICGTDEVLRPFWQKDATFLVDSLDESHGSSLLMVQRSWTRHNRSRPAST